MSEARPPLLIVTDVAPYRDSPAGVHGVLAQATSALAEVGSLCGLEPVGLASVADLTVDQVDAGGVVALFTIGETPFSPAQRTALSASWRRGDLGVLGVHAATDACYGWDDYGSILGGRFAGHPWTRSFDIEVVDPGHPATAHLPDPWPWHDEIYLFDELRPEAKVLLRIDPAPLDMTVPGARVPSHGLPLAWCHTEERGKTFYTALGHFPAAWESPVFLSHLVGGLQWLREDAP
jgi:type 1 glutamine amidotransferase